VVKHTLAIKFRDRQKPHAVVTILVWPLLAAVFYLTISGIFLGVVP
jgi:hypothetical protein